MLRRDTENKSTFTAPSWVPVAGAVTCLFLVGPWARVPEDYRQYQIGAGLLAIGVLLWGLTYLLHRRKGEGSGRFSDVDQLSD